MNGIKSMIIKGSIYNALSKYFSVLCNIVVVSFLARLLTPEDFGIIAITSVVIAFFDILANMGLGPAIIQKKNIDKGECSDVFSYSIYLAIILVGIFSVCIFPISRFYGDKQLVSVLFLLVIQLFFITINVVPNALILKEKRFKELSIISSINSFIFGIMSILAAYYGLGIYSLIISPICNSISLFISCLFMIRFEVYFKLFPNYLSLRKLLSFSIYQFLFNVINYFSRNMDKILVGKILGLEILGFYEKSYRLMTMPISNLTNVMVPTIQPVLSDYQNNKEILYNVYEKISKFLFVIGALLTPYLFFTAKELILIIFGSQWSNAIPIFQILSISVLFQIIDSLSGSIFQSANAVKYLFWSGGFCAFINMLFLFIGLFLFKNIIVTSCLISTSFILNFLISSYYINKVVFGNSLRNYLGIMITPLILMFLLSFLLFACSYINMSFIISVVVKFIVTVLVSYIYLKKTGYVDISLKSISGSLK